MKTSLFFVLSTAVLALSASAQTTPTPQNPQLPSKSPTTPEEALDSARKLIDVDVLWNKSVDWKATKASMADVVTQARAALGKQAPTIEVRTTDSPVTTFALKAAPLGRTLTAIAALANAKVWALPGRLVIAPPEALTPEENGLVQQKMGGEWKQRIRKWNAMEQLEQATLVMVGPQVKERLTAKALPLPPLLFPDVPQNNPTIPLVRKPYEIGFGELNPTTQQLLSNLFVARARFYDRSTSEAPTLNSLVTLSYNDSWGNSLELSLSRPRPDSAAEREILENWRIPYSTPKPTE